jgi:hypothetical protein
MSEPSFKGVNYSLRPSKTIQRGLVFEGLRSLREDLDWSRASYVGMGSIWFTDFVLAHKALGLKRMVSIESHPIGFRRAVFNKPYSFIRMKEGLTYDVVPTLYENEIRFPGNPAIVWLDYDSELDEDKLDELRYVVENATDDSVLLVTFNSNERHYGNEPGDRVEALQELFGNLAPQRMKGSEVTGLKFAATMADLTEKLMRSTSLRARKANPCVPAFSIVYQDKATMVTVGAVFPHREREARVKKRVDGRNWPAKPDAPVIAPHLTSKEASVLQANLPLRGEITRQDIRRLGFDLEEEQIEAFAKFYRHYPVFAQVFS